MLCIWHSMYRINGVCITIPPFLSPASPGLHHVHWLQHFLPLLDWCYHILLVIEVGKDRVYLSIEWSLTNIFLCYRKELIQKVHNFVHLNLCIALALGLLLFLTGVQTATANEVGLSLIGCALPYQIKYVIYIWGTIISHTRNVYSCSSVEDSIVL